MSQRFTPTLPLSALVFSLAFSSSPSAWAQDPPAKSASVPAAQPPASAQKVTFAFRAAAGQVKRVAAVATFTVPGAPGPLEFKEVDKITFTGVSPTGEVTWDSKTESIQRFLGGQKLPDDPTTGKDTDTYTVKPDGMLVSFKSTSMEKDPDHTDERIFFATSILFSDKPIAVGEKWVREFKANATLGTVDGKGEYEFQALEEKNGVLCARIGYTYTETTGKNPLNAKGLIWVEPASGDDVSTDIVVNNVPFGDDEVASAALKANRESGGALPPEVVAKAQAGLKSEQSAIKAQPPKVEPPKPKLIDDVVKDFEKIPGVVTLWRKKDESGRETLYAELREDQLDKLMLLQATFATGDADHAVAGDPISDFVFQFTRSIDDKIYMAVPNTNFQAAPGSPTERALQRSMPPLSYLQTYKIEAKQADRKALLIDVSEFFKSDFLGIGFAFSGIPPIPGLQMAPGGGMGLDREKTYVLSVKNFPENLVVTSQYHFVRGLSPTLLSAPTLGDPRSAPVKVTFNLSTLPVDNGYKPRLADARVGYFTTDFQILDRDDKLDVTKRFITRWDLKKKDPAAAVSEPVKPIVFWLDNGIPEEWRKPIANGILSWNATLEKVGFKNAIQLKQMPDAPSAEDVQKGLVPTDGADMRFNVVSWVISPNPNDTYAIAHFRVNPLTGQILNAGINIDAGMVQVAKVEHRDQIAPEKAFQRIADFDTLPLEGKTKRRASALQCELGSMARQNAWFGMTALNLLVPTKISPKEYTGQFLHEVVAHEFGHILGLRHNFVASTSLSLAQLGDPKVTPQGKATTASLMEYTPFNIAALKVDGVPFWSLNPGVYDQWAIQYGYTPVPSAQKPVDELPVLKQIARRSGEPGLAYNSDFEADTFDPTITRFDLAANPLDYWERVFQTAQELLPILDKQVKPGESYTEFTDQLNGIIDMYARAAGQSTRFIGGQLVRRSFKGDVGEKANIKPVAVADQKRALQLLVKYILAPGALTIPTRYLEKMTLDMAPLDARPAEYPIGEALASFQKSIVRRLLTSSTLTRVANNEYKLSGDATKALTLPYLFTSVGEAVWGELTTKKNVGYQRRQIQRQHVESLITLANATSTDDSRMLAAAHLRKLKEKLKLAQATPTLDEYTRLHYTDLAEKIQRVLEAKMTVGGSGGGGLPFLFGRTGDR